MLNSCTFTELKMVDIPEDFISELSQFLSRIRGTIAQDKNNRGGQCEVIKYPLYLPIYMQICYIVYSSSNTEHVVFQGLPYHVNVPDEWGNIMLNTM